MKLNIPNEYTIQVQLRQWMTLQHPTVLMHCDLSGIRLPIGYAVKIKKLNPCRAWPDIFIAEPRGKHHGLLIELKRSYADLYAKSGNYRKTQHIEEQRAMLKTLRQKGYMATFAIGFEGTQDTIEAYLDRRL